MASAEEEGNSDTLRRASEHGGWVVENGTHRESSATSATEEMQRKFAQRVFFGFAQDPGDRPYQEDRVSMDERVRITDGRDASYAGCFDGHGGGDCSSFLQERLLSLLTGSYASATSKPSSNATPDSTAAPAACEWTSNIKRSLIGAFARADEEFLRAGDTSGSTALVCVLLRDHLWLANAGDCRAVVFSNKRAHQITRDHCPSDYRERSRIERCGGAILNINERRLLLCGLVVHKRQIMSRILPSGLSVARAIGDSRVKETLPGAVVPSPDVFCWSIGESDEFIILASDGVFGAGGGGLSNEEACAIVCHSCHNAHPDEEPHRTAERAAQDLVTGAVQRARNLKREADNCSAIVLFIADPGKPDRRKKQRPNGFIAPHR